MGPAGCGTDAARGTPGWRANLAWLGPATRRSRGTPQSAQPKPLLEIRAQLEKLGSAGAATPQFGGEVVDGSAAPAAVAVPAPARLSSYTWRLGVRSSWNGHVTLLSRPGRTPSRIGMYTGGGIRCERLLRRTATRRLRRGATGMRGRAALRSRGSTRAGAQRSSVTAAGGSCLKFWVAGGRRMRAPSADWHRRRARARAAD